MTTHTLKMAILKHNSISHTHTPGQLHPPNLDTFYRKFSSTRSCDSGSHAPFVAADMCQISTFWPIYRGASGTLNKAWLPNLEEYILKTPAHFSWSLAANREPPLCALAQTCCWKAWKGGGADLACCKPSLGHAN